MGFKGNNALGGGEGGIWYRGQKAIPFKFQKDTRTSVVVLKYFTSAITNKLTLIYLSTSPKLIVASGIMDLMVWKKSNIPTTVEKSRSKTLIGQTHRYKGAYHIPLVNSPNARPNDIRNRQLVNGFKYFHNHPTKRFIYKPSNKSIWHTRFLCSVLYERWLSRHNQHWFRKPTNFESWLLAHR